MFITSMPGTPLAQLSIDTTWPSPGTARVAVDGEIDLSSSEVLRAALSCLLSERFPHRIEVDLAGVTFMDCGGLSVLAGVGNAAARTRCQLRITHAQPIVRRVLDLTGLFDVLTAGFDQTPLVAAAEYVTSSAGVLLAV